MHEGLLLLLAGGTGHTAACVRSSSSVEKRMRRRNFMAVCVCVDVNVDVGLTDDGADGPSCTCSVASSR